MASPESLYCTGVPTLNVGWTAGGTAANFVDAVSNDDDAKYIYNNGSGTARCGITTLSETPSRIVDVTITWKGCVNDPSHSHTTKVGTYLSGNYAWGTPRALANYPFTSYTESALARPGGGAWQVADIAAMEFALDTVLGVGAALVRTATIVVTYTKVGGFIFQEVLKRR